MKIERAQIVRRGLAGCCPNCGERTLFPPGVHLRINPQCRVCGLRFDRGEGFFLGPFVVNYSITVFGFVLPLLAAYTYGHLGGKAALALAGGSALLLPLLFYRLSWKGWLTGYFFFLPERLLANADDARAEQED